MQPWLEELQRRRTYRERPSLDDKIITSWKRPHGRRSRTWLPRLWGSKPPTGCTGRSPVHSLRTSSMARAGLCHIPKEARRSWFLDDYASFYRLPVRALRSLSDDQYQNLQNTYGGSGLSSLKIKNGAAYSSPAHITDLATPQELRRRGTAIRHCHCYLQHSKTCVTPARYHLGNALSRLTHASVPLC